MRILCASVTDSGCQGHFLAKALREYLDYEAVNVVLHDTWIEYPHNWHVGENITPKEVWEYARTCDFLIFGDHVFVAEGLPFDQLVKRNNTVTVYHGTPTRNNLELALNEQVSGWNAISPLQDVTIAPYLLAAPFCHHLIDLDMIDEMTRGVRMRKKLTVCHAPTKPGVKGTEQFEELMRARDDLDFVVISGKPWKEALRMKAECHICLDQSKFPAQSINVLEGLAMGQSVISNISPWNYAMAPKLPVTSFNEAYTDFNSAMDIAIGQWNDWSCERGREYVEENHSLEAVAPRWYHYLKYIKSLGD